MQGPFMRLGLLIGEDKLRRLAEMKIAIFGIGGVGGYIAEALVRCGVGRFVLIDSDKVDESNINRQIIADTTTVGRFKTEVMGDRILKINPSAQISEIREFYLPGAPLDYIQDCGYVIDAIDTISAKVDLAVRCPQMNIPLISAMGAGNKLDPTKFEAADIYETSECPLCRVMRAQLRKRGVKKLKVVYSKEKPVIPIDNGCTNELGRPVPGSIQMAPAACGLAVAYEVIKDTIL